MELPHDLRSPERAGLPPSAERTASSQKARTGSEFRLEDELDQADHARAARGARPARAAKAERGAQEAAPAEPGVEPEVAVPTLQHSGSGAQSAATKKPRATSAEVHATPAPVEAGAAPTFVSAARGRGPTAAPEEAQAAAKREDGAPSEPAVAEARIEPPTEPALEIGAPETPPGVDAELTPIQDASQPSFAVPAKATVDVELRPVLGEIARRVEAAPTPSSPAPAIPTQRAQPEQRAAEILRQVRVHLTPELESAVIELSPAELGRVSIRLEVNQERELTTYVRAERPEALEALRLHLPELRAALARQGLEVRQFELSLGFQDSRAGHGTPHETPDRPRRGSGGAAREQASLTPLRALLAADAIDTYA